MNKRVLILFYSQSGQLSKIVRSIAEPLAAHENIDVVYECLQPAQPFPFPWPFLQFFDTFPETVYDDPRPILPLSESAKKGNFDLVIIAYQVWFLSPSQPITAFLQSTQSRHLLAGKPVITVIGCRNMWLMAQEKMKQHLQRLDAHLIDNVVLTDPALSATTFFSTPVWVLTGNKGPFFNGLIPAAGVSVADIEQASRFGRAIAAKLPALHAEDYCSMLSGLGAVQINENLIAPERIAIRSFRIWGALLRVLGSPGSFVRRLVLITYVIFLIIMILTVVPISAVANRLTAPFRKRRSAQQRRYYAGPSGETCDRVASLHD